MHAVIVRRAFSPTDNDDLATDKCRRVCATWWWQVALHLGMRPLHRLCERIITSSAGHYATPRAAVARTDIEAPHVLETPSVIAAAEYPCHIVHEGDGVCAKAMGGERAPDRSLAPIHRGRRCRFDVEHVWEMGDRTKAGRWVEHRSAG